MSNPSDVYYLVAVKTSLRTKGGSRSKNRVNPLPGQGFDTDLFVECSRTIRDKYPTGTVFLIWAKETDREGGTPFLYSYHSWDFKPVREALALQWIARGQIGKGKFYATPEEIKLIGLTPWE